MSSVATQLYQSYPNILEMLVRRGYDTNDYPPLELEHIEHQNQQHMSMPASPQKPLAPIPPIVVESNGTSIRPIPFAECSRERNELKHVLKNTDPETQPELSTGFRKRYPVLAALVDILADEQTREDALSPHSTVKTCVDACIELYLSLAKPVAEVHFHQCFNPENIWGANIRDRKFMAEMQAMITAMEATARAMIDERSSTLKGSLQPNKWDTIREAMCNELVSIFKRSRTIICCFRTRSKASETLDSKYETHCLDLMAQHGVFVQLFNLKKLMFNVCAHEIVPEHTPLDLWHDGEEIERIKRVYNIKNPSKEFHVIPLNDPVAKFIGLRRGQLCKIVRINDTGGTYVDYRWCK